MGTERTIYHAYFTMLLEELKPHGIEVRPEQVLTTEPQKADLLMIQTTSAYDPSTAGVLRGLWPHLTERTILEYKSPGRPPRAGDWIKLLGYGAQYHAKNAEQLDGGGGLTLVFVVPKITPTVRTEARRLKWRIRPLPKAGPGYYLASRQPYRSLLVVLDEVAKAERDHLLAWFARATIATAGVRRWLMAHSTQQQDSDLEALEGYDELMEKLLARATPAQRVAGLAPEERVAGLSEAERLLTLPPSALRALSADYVRSLPEAVRAEIERRLAADTL